MKVIAIAPHNNGGSLDESDNDDESLSNRDNKKLRTSNDENSRNNNNREQWRECREERLQGKMIVAQRRKNEWSSRENEKIKHIMLVLGQLVYEVFAIYYKNFIAPLSILVLEPTDSIESICNLLQNCYYVTFYTSYK